MTPVDSNEMLFTGTRKIKIGRETTNVTKHGYRIGIKSL